jgi:hypothetical protein
MIVLLGYVGLRIVFSLISIFVLYCIFIIDTVDPFYLEVVMRTWTDGEGTREHASTSGLGYCSISG